MDDKIIYNIIQMTLVKNNRVEQRQFAAKWYAYIFDFDRVFTSNASLYCEFCSCVILKFFRDSKCLMDALILL